VLQTGAAAAGMAAVSGAGVAEGSTAADDETGLDGLDPVVHLAADELDAADGDAVGTWTDLTDNGNDATQDADAKRPTYSEADGDQIAGKPVVVFDGEDDFLNLDSEAVTLDDFSVFVVGQWNASTNAMFGTYSPDTDAMDRFRIANFDAGASAYSYQFGENVWWETNVVAEVDTDPHLWGVTSTANGVGSGTHRVTPYLDGDRTYEFKYGTLHHSVDESPGDFNLGKAQLVNGEESLGLSGDGVTDMFYDGTVAEVLVFDRSLDDEEIDQVHAHLTDKYEQFDHEILDGANDPIPVTEEQLQYDGRAEDAGWRETAQERIEDHRKADLEVEVVDPAGRAVEDATVDVTMQSHEFNFGTAVSGDMVADSETGLGDTYRDVLASDFNYGTIETDLKVYNWEGSEDTRADARETVEWLNDQGHDVRGHAAFWEQYWWMNIDPDQPDEEIIQQVTDKIEERVAEFEGQLADWDCQNHPINFQQIRSDVGDEAVLDWWETAQSADTEAAMGINEMNVLTRYAWSDGYDEELVEWTNWLLENGVDVDAVGAMCHAPITNLTGIPDVISRLDRLDEAFGLPVYISEFHVPLWMGYKNWGGASQKKKDAQADYVRDFLTAVFSHPAVETFVHWNFWAGRAWRSTSCLYDVDWDLRTHGEEYLDLVFDEWWTDEEGTTGSDGIYATSAFKGEYEITVEEGKRSGDASVTVSDDGASVEVVISVGHNKSDGEGGGNGNGNGPGHGHDQDEGDDEDD